MDYVKPIGLACSIGSDERRQCLLRQGHRCVIEGQRLGYVNMGESHGHHDNSQETG